MSESATAPAGLYAYTECDTVNLRAGVTLIMDWWSDAQMIAAPSVAEPLQLCRRFRTLEEHAQVLMASVPELAGQQDNVMNVLGMVKDAGLLVSAESVCARLNMPAPPAVDLPSTRAFIITCDRPQAVERLLETMLRGGNLSRHEALFLVDDSRSAENAARNREAVASFNLTSPRDMHYFGADEARQLMDQLITALPEHEDSIRFLIDRQKWAQEKTYGLARNLCLLLSVGHRAIVLDDDVIFQVRRAPHRQEGIAFGIGDREFDCYADERDMLAHCPVEDIDPLTGHASCLGLSMGQVLAKLLGRPLTAADLAGANSSFLNLWQTDSPVLITQCGTLGDPGSPSREWLYLASGNSAQRLAAGGNIQQMLSGHNFWMGHTRPTFSKMAVMSQTTGIDNSRLLPPYFPVFRGEDYLFGAMTEFLHPHGSVLSYDWAVPHLPVDQRAVNTAPQPKSGKGQVSLAKYVTDRTVYRRGITPETRLAQLAALSRELSEADDRALKTLYRKEVAEMQGLELDNLASLLQDGVARTADWQDWLSASLNALNESMQTPAQLGDLRSVPESMGPDEVLATFRMHAGGFAHALAGWSDIRQAARAVADRLRGENAFTP
mgnify:CR=1 FL=1